MAQGQPGLEDVIRYLRETRGEDERAKGTGRSLSVGFRARGALLL